MMNSGNNRRLKKTMAQVPSDYMSFSTFYNKEFQMGGASKKQKHGPRRVNCFELMNFAAGRHMTSIFDVRGKKKDII